MLKDRRVLLEEEIKKAHTEAANMYLSIAVGNNGSVSSVEYRALRERITSLQFDLNVVNQLIHKGHE